MLSKIIAGSANGLITSVTSKSASLSGAGTDKDGKGNLHLAPGAIWRRIETRPAKINLGDVIGEGAFAKVHKCTFQEKIAACKIFRNSKEESAFKEIEIMFSLRHPNIIGLYAWFQIKGQFLFWLSPFCLMDLNEIARLPLTHTLLHTETGTLTQIGMVIEMAGRGDLTNLYDKKKNQKYSFKLGLKALTGAAKGLAHMHMMPTPFVHRDVKSSNIMVMGDGTGKLGDCGESRRIDLESTMTQTGTPLWAAPEILAGKRYCEDVDTYSLGCVMYEIVVREFPHTDYIAKLKMKLGKKASSELMRQIAFGLRKPELADKGKECRRSGVGREFKKRRSFARACGHIGKDSSMHPFAHPLLSPR